jgi:hypothetical protein
MRFFRLGRQTSPPPLEPTPSEAFVLREFGEAIAFARGEWRSFDRRFQEVDPEWRDTFSLAQRIAAFVAGPIGAALEKRFPAIAATGARADEMTNLTGNARVIRRLIVGEAVIAAGDGGRGEVRRALPD